MLKGKDKGFKKVSIKVENSINAIDFEQLIKKFKQATGISIKNKLKSKIEKKDNNKFKIKRNIKEISIISLASFMKLGSAVGKLRFLKSNAK